MLVRENQFEQAGELFFEAAAVPELWPQALQAVADACGAKGALFTPIRAAPDFCLPSPRIEEVIKDFVDEGWATTNPRMKRGLELTRAGMKGLITDTDMFTPEELAADRFYNEFIVPHGFSANAGMVLASFGHELVLPFMLERGRGDGPFLRDEIAVMNRLMVRLQPAAQLALKVGFAASRSTADSLAAVGRDILLLGWSGRVLHMAPGTARHVGDALTLTGGVVSSWNRDTSRRLAAMIARAVSSGSGLDRVAGGIALPRKSGRRPLLAQVVPIVGAAHDVFMLARAIVILTDPDQAGDEDPLAGPLSASGLSPAEARLARRIGAGEDLKAIAKAENIAIETARARLKSVFAKTGTHRQAELAILIASLLW